MIGLDLKAEMVRRGVQQIEVARLIGMDKSLLSRRLNEPGLIPADDAKRICEAVDQIAAEKAAAVRADADRRIARLLGDSPSTEAEATAA